MPALQMEAVMKCQDLQSHFLASDTLMHAGMCFVEMYLLGPVIIA